MGNTYYAIRVDSAANTLADLKAALLDYYGAYNDPANLDGVRFDYDTSPYLIFRCTAFADQYIRAYWNANQLLFSYGDGVTGNNVTNPVPFGGTSTIGMLNNGHLVLSPHTLLWVGNTNDIYLRLVVIGLLTNDDYAVLGASGASNSSYHINCNAYNTTDGVQLYPAALDHGFQSAAGKLYVQRLILSRGAVGLELDVDGAVASFQDVMNASYVTPANSALVTATAILTPCGLYMHSSYPVLPTCLLMEYDEVT